MQTLETSMDPTNPSRRKVLALGSLFLLLAGCRNSIQGTSGRPPVAPGSGDGNPNPQGSTDPNSQPQAQVKTDPQASANLDLVGLKVTLDVGHAFKGNDGPAVEKGVNEHAQVRKQSAIIAEKLKARGASVNVKIYEFADTSLLAARGKAGLGSTVLVSLHHNAFSTAVQGSETLVSVKRGKVESDKKFAKFIHDAVIAALWKGDLQQYGGGLNRGVKTQVLGVLNNTPTEVEACCLTEPYFISGQGSPANAQAWTDASAHAIADGIAQWWKAKSGSLSLYALTEPPDTFELTPSDPIDAELYKNH